MSHINTLVVAALNTAATFSERVAAIRAACPRAMLSDAASLADYLRPGVAKFHGITLTEKSTGRLVFPADDKRTNAAKLDLSRLVRSVIGKTSNHSEPKKIRVAASERSAAQALLDACGGDVARARAVLKALG